MFTYLLILMYRVFQEIDSKEAEEELKRSSQATRKASNRGVSAATKAAKKPPPQPRKYTKKAKNVEPDNDNSSMEVGKSELRYLSPFRWDSKKYLPLCININFILRKSIFPDYFYC